MPLSLIFGASAVFMHALEVQAIRISRRLDLLVAVFDESGWKVHVLLELQCSA